MPPSNPCDCPLPHGTKLPPALICRPPTSPRQLAPDPSLTNGPLRNRVSACCRGGRRRPLAPPECSFVEGPSVSRAISRARQSEGEPAIASLPAIHKGIKLSRLRRLAHGYVRSPVRYASAHRDRSDRFGRSSRRFFSGVGILRLSSKTATRLEYPRKKTGPSAHLPRSSNFEYHFLLEHIHAD